MSVKAKFDSQDPEYRNPTGAVTIGTSVNFKVVLEKTKSVQCLMRYRIAEESEQICPMERMSESKEACSFTCTLKMPSTPSLVWYEFVIRDGEEYGYLCNAADRLGGESILVSEPTDPFQITVYRKMEESPNWFAGGVMYQIFVDRFARGTKLGEYPRPALIHSDWMDSPYYLRDEEGRILRYDFFGGNLDGVREKLPYLKELGITILYLNPIFESPSNHKYDTADYRKIDPNFGDEADFTRLCEEAEQQGISIVLDGVFSHVGSDSRYFNREGFYEDLGAYQSKESPYYGWFRFRRHPDDYESWWGIDTMPNIEEENLDYQDFMLGKETGVIAHWMNKGVKGWRLDVADELPDKFIQGIHRRVQEEKADGIVIGEVWEDASNKISYGKQREYLFGGELDSVMNYPYREGILRFVRREENALSLSRTIRSIHENYPKEVFQQLMNFLGTHDTIRVLNAMIYGEEPNRPKSELMQLVLRDEELSLALKRLALAVQLLFTLPGVPCVYYGDEAGLEGWKDPFNRRTYPWGAENQSIYELYRKWIRRYREHPALSYGVFKASVVQGQCFTHLRETEEECFFCIVNSGDERAEGAFPSAGIWKDLDSNEMLENSWSVEGEIGRIFVKVSE
jgi:4-alpha-glucanotransferase